MEIIDLHVHTTASDGSLTPREVVRRAKALGLKAIAVTDHDTVAGVEEALEEGILCGLEVIPGIEISVDVTKGTCHLLGYFIDYKDKDLLKRLLFIQRAREERNLKMLQKLKALGIDLTLEEVKAQAKDGQICRPHFALAMIKKGYVSSVDEAFERFLKKGGPAYVEKFRLSPEEAIRMILQSKGIPVLAHPFTLELEKEEFETFLKELKQHGLKGIEAYYPDHTLEQTEFYERLGKKYGLLITGGTDFHGPPREEIELGKGRGNLSIPYELLLKLKEVRWNS
jgi:predicted metal-dependent phosphoesterase TrpH